MANFVATPVPGVVLYPVTFERAVDAIRQAIDAAAAKESCQRLVAPPVIARSTVEQAGYLEAFPQLLGSVYGQSGPEPGEVAMSDTVLVAATCHHVYPLLAGQALSETVQYVIHGSCFRQEASAEPGRLRAFRMSELVHIGGADTAEGWRNAWLRAMTTWLSGLGLDAAVAVADDPFFGPGGRILRASQREQQLKFELQVPVTQGIRQAVASVNYHKDHFGAAFGISTDRGPAHTACAAFGLERIALALMYAQGPDPARWPDQVHVALAGLGPAATDEQTTTLGERSSTMDLLGPLSGRRRES